MRTYPLALLALFTVTACTSPSFQKSVDPSGASLEHIAVREGFNSYQFDSLSPDGSHIAIAWDDGADARGTYLLDLETGAQLELPEFNNGASFSPDGKTLLNSVYVQGENTDIAELDRATRELTLLCENAAPDWLPSYSPDGQRILFNSFRSGNSDIYLYDKPSAKLTRLTRSPAYEAHAQFSPDGESIVFHRQQGRGNFDIILIDLASGEEYPLTGAPGEESYPSWSNDGTHIFYSSDEDCDPGKTDIFVMTRDGDDARRLIAHPAKDAYAFQSPDGRHLYFTSYREPQGVYRMELDEAF